MLVKRYDDSNFSTKPIHRLAMNLYFNYWSNIDNI